MEYYFKISFYKGVVIIFKEIEVIATLKENGDIVKARTSYERLLIWIGLTVITLLILKHNNIDVLEVIKTCI